MSDPVFWLGLSVGLVAAGILAIFVALVPAAKELAEAARSVKQFFNLLQRDLPPTLEALRLTSLEVSDIADSVDDGVKSAGRIVKRVDDGLEGTRTQARDAGVAARSVVAGVRAGWKVFLEERDRGERALTSQDSPRSNSDAGPRQLDRP
ncbi:hypothetical protein [Synechococcus sp. PCC 7336]|uniref:hypothetical protein n=1 Tax=Synechococcus sp. PCC 7336 TaxID=195250 RepID=UPI00034A34A8|nr:hypothetical protein [Synechococcus sp. PCC 7336]